MLLYWNLENANFSKPEKNHDQLIQVRWSRERSKKGRKWLSRNRSSQKKVQCRSQVEMAFAFFCHILKKKNCLLTNQRSKSPFRPSCMEFAEEQFSPGTQASSHIPKLSIDASVRVNDLLFSLCPVIGWHPVLHLSPKVSSDRLQFTLIGTTEDKLMAIPDFIHKVSYSTCPVGGKRTNNMIKASQNFFYKQIGILQN